VRNETQMRKLSDSTVMTKCADILNWSFFFSLWSNESVYCTEYFTFYVKN